jgi:hypothetical protein
VGLASIVAHEEGQDLDALGERKVDQSRYPGIVASEALALVILRFDAMSPPVMRRSTQRSHASLRLALRSAMSVAGQGNPDLSSALISRIAEIALLHWSSLCIDL